jgi:hypothetical protein
VVDRSLEEGARQRVLIATARRRLKFPRYFQGGARRVHTWTVCHHAFNFAFKAATPYIVVLADMDT